MISAKNFLIEMELLHRKEEKKQKAKQAQHKAFTLLLERLKRNTKKHTNSYFFFLYYIHHLVFFANGMTTYVFRNYGTITFTWIKVIKDSFPFNVIESYFF